MIYFAQDRQRRGGHRTYTDQQPSGPASPNSLKIHYKRDVSWSGTMGFCGSGHRTEEIRRPLRSSPTSPNRAVQTRADLMEFIASCR